MKKINQFLENNPDVEFKMITMLSWDEQNKLNKEGVDKTIETWFDYVDNYTYVNKVFYIGTEGHLYYEEWDECFDWRTYHAIAIKNDEYVVAKYSK